MAAAACGKPCDTADPRCYAFDFGYAAFAANPAAVEGEYVPALAGCTVTAIPEGGAPASDRVIETRSYDAIGRLAYQVHDLGKTENDAFTYTWDGPCPVRYVREYGATGVGATVIHERTCDKQGWPIGERQYYMDAGESQDSPYAWQEYQRTYDSDGRLLEVAEYARDSEGAEPTLSRTQLSTWQGDKVVDLQVFSDNGLIQETSWKWNTAGLLTSEWTHWPALQPQPSSSLWSWEYDGRRLVELRLDDTTVLHTWEWAPGAKWPHRRLTPDGPTATLHYACPAPG